MAAKDYYDVLGVGRNATEDEIKDAYRKLVRQYHPDTNKDNPDAEKKMAEINEAYTVLSNKEKRAKYDQFGQVPPEGAGFPGGGYGVNFTDDLGSFADIFDTMFGGGGRSQRPRGQVVYEGADIRTDVSITLQEAFSGKTILIDLQRFDKCPECEGTGAAKGTKPETCPDCRGSGQVKRTQQTFLGTFQTVGTCPRCGGSGKIISSPCPKCKGETLIKATHKIEVKIPAGIEDGMRVRLAGQGDSGKNGGRPGDLYVMVHVKPDKIFTREGANIYSQVTISMYEAALGAEITIYTIDGKEKISIKSGTQPSDTMTLKSKGMPYLNSSRRGDHIINFKVTVPKKLSQKEKSLLKQIMGVKEE